MTSRDPANKPNGVTLMRHGKAHCPLASSLPAAGALFHLR
jgi:hypothetical protein